MLNEEEGFSFGDPWNYEKSNGAILPIRRKGRRRRKYRTLEEILKDTRDAVEVTETGFIRKVKVLNRTDVPIFVRMGTIFSGVGTQSRAAEGSVILVPNKKARPVEVRCVEAAVPIRGGTQFHVAAFSAPHHVEMGLYARDQDDVWDRVRSYAESLRFPGRRGRGTRERMAHRYRARGHSLVDILDSVEGFKEQVDEVLEVVPNYEDQVGVVVLDDKGVVGVEAFDTPKSWEAVSDSVVKKYAEVISIPQGEDATPEELDKDKIVRQSRRFLQKLAAARGKVTFRQSGHRTFALSGKGLVGEYTSIDGDVMHLTGVRFERKPKKKRRIKPPMDPLPALSPREREEFVRRLRNARRETRGGDR